MLDISFKNVHYLDVDKNKADRIRNKRYIRYAIMAIIIIIIIVVVYEVSSSDIGLFKPRFEDTISMPFNTLSMAQNINPDIPLDEIANRICKNRCASNCAGLDMTYRYSNITKKLSSFDCLCQCD